MAIDFEISDENDSLHKNNLKNKLTDLDAGCTAIVRTVQVWFVCLVSRAKWDVFLRFEPQVQALRSLET